MLRHPFIFAGMVIRLPQTIASISGYESLSDFRVYALAHFFMSIADWIHLAMLVLVRPKGQKKKTNQQC
jgi:hypothetical protein